MSRINTRIINKHDIEENWRLAVNFAPLEGEIIIYDADETHDQPRVKIGDGKTNVNVLPFIDKAIWEQFSTMNQITATDDGDGNITLGATALASTEEEEY